jgi:hypothetical protein
MRRFRILMLAAALALAGIAQIGAAQSPSVAQSRSVDVTGAWDVTISLAGGGSISGLSVLSQDDAKVVGMLGPALTEMFPVEGTWEGGTLTIRARPRTGRTTAFARCDLTGTHERITGTIDGGKGTIEFVRKQRTSPPAPRGRG